MAVVCKQAKGERAECQFVQICHRLALNLLRSVKFGENGQNFAPEFKRIRKMIAIYFSSTGNTKHCTQRFIECLGRGIPPV